MPHYPLAVKQNSPPVGGIAQNAPESPLLRFLIWTAQVSGWIGNGREAMRQEAGIRLTLIKPLRNRNHRHLKPLHIAGWRSWPRLPDRHRSPSDLCGTWISTTLAATINDARTRGFLCKNRIVQIFCLGGHVLPSRKVDGQRDEMTKTTLAESTGARS